MAEIFIPETEDTTAEHSDCIRVAEDSAVFALLPKPNLGGSHPREIVDVIDELEHEWTFAFVFRPGQESNRGDRGYFLTGTGEFLDRFNLTAGDTLIFEKQGRTMSIRYRRGGIGFSANNQVIKLGGTRKSIYVDSQIDPTSGGMRNGRSFSSKVAIVERHRATSGEKHSLQAFTRSQLQDSPPCGLGTIRTESLTGYIARIVALHGASMRTLFDREFVCRLREAQDENDGMQTDLRPTRLHTMNGLGVVNDVCTRFLEERTNRDDLRFLTMGVWRDVLPSSGLFREKRAWCPECYEGDEVTHEHLLWCLAPVTICPCHLRPLETRCPYCRQNLPIFSWHSVPGFCSSCRGWLGTVKEETAAKNSDAVTKTHTWERWVAENLGGLIAIAPSLTNPPVKERIPQMLTTLTGCVDADALAHGLDVSYMAAWAWSTGQLRPLISHLLPICEKFKISLAALYAGDIPTRGEYNHPRSSFQDSA